MLFPSKQTPLHFAQWQSLEVRSVIIPPNLTQNRAILAANRKPRRLVNDPAMLTLRIFGLGHSDALGLRLTITDSEAPEALADDVSELIILVSPLLPANIVAPFDVFASSSRNEDKPARSSVG